MWNYLEYKGRVGRTHVVVSSKDDPLVLGVMPASARCRYFEEGRLRMSRSIQRRLGRYEKVPGLMQTLTYDPKRIAQPDAWASFGSDTRRFINAVNQYRKRRGWRRLHYLWMVEVQDGTGYPHVHIFFPKLKWIAPLSIINGNWRHGRANIESPRKIKVNCAAYISKYLRKMKGRAYLVNPSSMDVAALRELIAGKAEFLLRLMENPNLLEHERFTHLLMATFHLEEELVARSEEGELPESDLRHLAGDVDRVYGQLARFWLDYMKYLKTNYPYLFSLAVRMNPFDQCASPVVR